MEELGTRDLEELEYLYTQAMAGNDTLLAQTIAYLISQKQQKLLE